MTDYYKELNLDRNLSCREISDRLTESETYWLCREAVNPIKAQQELDVISKAKEIFKDDESRKEYDSELIAKRQNRELNIPINTAELNDKSESKDSIPEESPVRRRSRRDDCYDYPEERYGRSRYGRRYRRDGYGYRWSRMWGGRAKSYFAVACVGIAAASVLFWLVVFAAGFGETGTGIAYYLREHQWLVISICFAFFFLLGGFPWGWILFWPLWRDFLMFVRFFFMSIIRWPLLFICCFGFGWINMLIHIPTIIRDLKGR